MSKGDKGVTWYLVRGTVAAHVHAGYVHGRVLGGSGDYDLLGAPLEEDLGFVDRGVLPGAVHHVLGARLLPGDLLAVSLHENLDLGVVDDEVLVVGAHLAVVPPVDGVVLEEVGQVLGFVAGLVYHHHFRLFLDGRAQEYPADAAEAVDADLRHGWIQRDGFLVNLEERVGGCWTEVTR